jgi:hypothetical protein
VILATKLRRGERTPRQSLTSVAASSKEAMRVENLLEGAVRHGTGRGCLASS